MFDLGYMRLLPNMVVMAPGDAVDTRAMIEFALAHDTPCAIRFPKATAETIAGARTPIELGRAEVIDWGHDGMIVACGTLANEAVKAAATLRDEGLDVGVINARFVKPLDSETILRAVATSPFVVTVEEAALAAGFTSAVVEAATDAALSCTHVRRLGIPDRFIEHAERGELLADLGLDAAGIAAACRQMAARTDVKQPDRRRVS
jgi:1-deoxy-D-xylulose-5-phosphate synthase